MLALVLIALAQTPQPRLFLQPNLPRKSALPPPQFQFAPANGAGMGAVCAGTTPTGSGGETMTFSRASARACMTGGETTGIANGSVVMLTSGQPVVQPGGDGTGALGLSLWGARTNTVLRNQEYDNPVWNGFGDFIPTVTANAGTAPTGAAVADRVQFAATSAGQRTLLYQASTCPVGLDSMSCFFRGVSGSGTLDMAYLDNTDGWANHACSFTNTSWTRCLMEGVTLASTGVNSLFSIGNMSSTNGGTARGASDVYVWGCQCEAGVTASPVILTAGATASTVADVASFSFTARSSLSLGATYVPPANIADYRPAASVTFAQANETTLGAIGAKGRCDFTASGVEYVSHAVSNVITPAPLASSCSYPPRLACSGGGYCSLDAGAVTLATGASTLYIGGQFDAGVANGTVKLVCADSSSARCRASSSNLSCPTTEASTVAAFGDSIMVGAFEVQMVEQMNDYLCPLGKRALNFAVSGATIADCGSQYHTSIKGHAYSNAMTECGINDLLGGATAATAWTAMESLLEDVTRDGGFHVIVGNLIPCGGYVSCDDTKVQSFNAKEADWCADAGSRATCLNNYATLRAATNVRWASSHLTEMGSLCLPSADNLHPNNYCTTYLANTFAAAVP